MRFSELLLGGMVAWTAIGAAGTMISLLQGQRARALRGVRWIVGAWAAYMLVLVGVSLKQPERRVPMRQDQCFDEMCFAVTGLEEVAGFPAKGQDTARLLRVQIRVTNRAKGKTEGDGLLRAYLLDEQGRRWGEVRGLSGVRLGARVAAGDSVVSEPVFRVPRDATGLRLELTHGRWQPGVLTIGDPDSWLHRPATVALGL